MRVAVALILARRPAFRVLLLREASLIDDEQLEVLRKLCDEFDAQAWIERVGPGSEDGIVIEDGAVKGGDA